MLLYFLTIFSVVQLFGWDNGVTGRSTTATSSKSLMSAHGLLNREQWSAKWHSSPSTHGCCTGGVVAMTGFLEQFFPETIGSEGTQAGDLYCTYNNQKIQWFTSSLFLAGAATELSGTTGQLQPMHATSLNAPYQSTRVCSLPFLRRIKRRGHCPA